MELTGPVRIPGITPGCTTKINLAGCATCSTVTEIARRKANAYCGNCRTLTKHTEVSIRALQRRLLWRLERVINDLGITLKYPAADKFEDGKTMWLTSRRPNLGNDGGAAHDCARPDFTLSLHPHLTPWALEDRLRWIWKDLGDPDVWSRWKDPSEGYTKQWISWSWGGVPTDTIPVVGWDATHPFDAVTWFEGERAIGAQFDVIDLDEVLGVAA